MKPVIMKKERARGVTLVELTIVIVIIGIIGAALAPVMLSSLRAYENTRGDLVVLDKLRYATERLAREIREVNYDSTSGFAFTSNTTCTTVMASNCVAFTRTFYDSSGSASTATVTVGNTGSTVSLAYSNSTPAIAAQTLTDELSSLAFAYYDSTGAAGASVTNVRSVQITLTLRHNGNDYTQSTKVELKNVVSS